MGGISPVVSLREAAKGSYTLLRAKCSEIYYGIDPVRNRKPMGFRRTRRLVRISYGIDFKGVWIIMVGVIRPSEVGFSTFRKFNNLIFTKNVNK